MIFIYKTKVQVVREYRPDINFLDAVMVKDKVYSAILKLQSNAARVELIYDWPIFLSTSNSLTNFYLESDIPGTLKASPLLQISSSIPVKK